MQNDEVKVVRVLEGKTFWIVQNETCIIQLNYVDNNALSIIFMHTTKIYYNLKCNKF